MIAFFLLTAVVALVFCWFLKAWIFKHDEGTASMKEIAGFIKEGAQSYLNQQYTVVGIFFAIMFLFMIIFKMNIVAIGFVTGGFCSALCGWIGMYIATNSSARTAFAARKSLNAGLRVSFSAGTVMGLTVVGLALLYLSISFFLLHKYYSSYLADITSKMLSFGMGASCYALFARVGGGIYTKAADVGADLVGKVEIGIPEDDPRNPAVIADQVGDNVGDVAGMGADLYESYVDSIVAAMALAVTAGLGVKGVYLPLLLSASGIIASIVGFFFVRTKKDTQKDLLLAMRRGVFFTAFMIVLAAYFIITSILWPQASMLPQGISAIGFFGAIVCGLIAGILLGMVTEYYTSTSFKPIKTLSKSSLSGPATIVIGGISLGMISTLLPVILMCIAIFLSFRFAGGLINYNTGLYGIGIASVALLSTLGTTLASDAYGPVADNAGGIAEMSGLEKEVREKTDKLDSLGNTTAATGKGFAIGSAALTTLALIVAFKASVEQYTGKPMNLSLTNVQMLLGLLIGGMLPFAFCSLTIRAVGEAAEFIVEEVRRQFNNIKGLLEGQAKADYTTCVRITTQAAQKKMMAPALLALAAPLLVGVLFSIEAVAGLLVGSLISGFSLAVMMANAGGAWDNAKKYIEEGKWGGKGSSAHKAAVVGDTIGDPFKDTAGPSLNILLKLMAMVSIVFSPLIIRFSIF